MISVTKRSKVKSAALAALIALNALLVAVLILRHGPENQAQAAGARVGDVLAVPGQISGASDGVVFLLDTANPPRLSVMTVDSANRRNSEGLIVIPLAMRTSGVHSRFTVARMLPITKPPHSRPISCFFDDLNILLPKKVSVFKSISKAKST